jgi:hypothetical protein
MAYDPASLLDQLRIAYATGARSIAYEGKTITYGSMEEMRAAIASLEAQLGIVQGKSVVVRSEKGW